jgi:hypothetical protein
MTKLCCVCATRQCCGASPRCEICRRLVQQAGNSGAKSRTRIAPQAAERAIAEAAITHRRLYPGADDGFACYYSGISLATDKNHSASGSYVSFDHVVPNNAAKAVLCSRIINDLKGWMTDTEFHSFVCTIIDLEAPRRIHGLDLLQSREFLTALRTVMRDGDEEAVESRRQLQTLSSLIKYEKSVAALLQCSHPTDLVS